MSKDAERKMERWFQHLPLEHPYVRVLFEAAVERQVGIYEILHEQDSRIDLPYVQARQDGAVWDVVAPPDGAAPPQPRQPPPAAERPARPFSARARAQAGPGPSAAEPPKASSGAGPRLRRRERKPNAMERLMNWFGWRP